jgi:hypothetical protein
VRNRAEHPVPERPPTARSSLNGAMHELPLDNRSNTVAPVGTGARLVRARRPMRDWAKWPMRPVATGEMIRRSQAILGEEVWALSGRGRWLVMVLRSLRDG